MALHCDWPQIGRWVVVVGGFWISFGAGLSESIQLNLSKRFSIELVDSKFAAAPCWKKGAMYGL